MRSLERLLDKVQKESFEFFVKENNPEKGIVRDKSEKKSPSSIAVTGMALASYVVAVERGFMKKSEAVKRTLAALRFFDGSEQGGQPDATGRNGFYYHFLDIKSGRRTWDCELSTVDSGLLFLGMLVTAQYFCSACAEEREINERVQAIVSRADWNWARNQALTLSHGYKPGRGFIKYRWEGYCEGLLLYILGIGADTHRLSKANYDAWAKTYEWKQIYGYEVLYAGPLFIHQFSHLWIDFRAVQDEFTRARATDYFENSRRATYIQQQYCAENPKGFADYSAEYWGITASDGPGPATRRIKGRKQKFFGYRARGVPFGPDDGTLSPWAAITSLPFAPEIVLPTIESFFAKKVDQYAPYGFAASFNPTFKISHPPGRWESPYTFGLNQGPLMLMVENFRTGLIWKLMRNCPAIKNGLLGAGFQGGWLRKPK